MKKVLLFLTAITMSFFVMGQNELDALRYSYLQYFGSSRSMGMSNAFSALGADPGSYVVNPAALGLAKFSDFSITTGFKMNTTTANFNGTQTKDIKYNLGINNLSAVFVNTYKNSPIKNFNLAITYNKLFDFNTRAMIEGVNDKGSMIDYFVYLSDGLPPGYLSDDYTGLAYDTYLTDVIDTVNWYYIGANDVNGNLYYNETQRKVFTSSGSGGSWDFSAAVNVENKLFLGLSLSAVSMNYTYISTYSEYNFPAQVDLKSFNFNENIKDRVTGYGIKAGVTLVPVKFMRLFVSAQSPYFLKVSDSYNSSIESFWYTPDLDGNTQYLSESPLMNYTYKVTTPWRINSGVGLVIKKMLALDFEYELVDYSVIRMSADDYTFPDANQAIQNNFYNTSNFRGGAELNIKGFQIRGGVAKYGAPYERLHDTWVASGDFGIRLSQMYFDMSISKRMQKEDYWFYVPYTDEPTPDLTYDNLYITFTLGTKIY